jgi:hypothetical protein
LLCSRPTLELPVINFRRVNIPTDIPLPPRIGNFYDDEKAEVRTIGLERRVTTGQSLKVLRNRNIRTGAVPAGGDIGAV